ncbi:MAG: riboflavin biosynthesis protein RibF [Clostridia bacterium]|nr:riboflavin biosynthesis protein RibF [Clostridia bacterium]
MPIIKNLKTGKTLHDPVLFIAALGSFDGVHVGHRKVILDAISLAKSTGVASAAWYFEDSPKGSATLTDNGEKERLIALLGADLAVTERFDAVKDMEPEEFVDSLVLLGCRGAVCGFNFRFGRGASGDSATLKTLCEKRGLSCFVVPPVTYDGDTVSSSAIRRSLEEGDVARASAMLGRRFSVTTPVAHGRTLGRTLGFPTVNQTFPAEKAILRRGVYFTVTNIDGALFPSVSNFGVRPTVGGHECRLETHIMGTDADLYGKTLTVSFLEFRRDETEFPNEASLVCAVSRDKDAAKEYFSSRKALCAALGKGEEPLDF